MRRKDNGGLKLQRWNVIVLVVMFCGHLRAAEEQAKFDEASLFALVPNAVMETNREVFLVFYQLL